MFSQTDPWDSKVPNQDLMWFQPFWCVDSLVAFLLANGESRPDSKDGKNQLNEPQLNCTSIVVLEDYMKTKYSIAEKNYDLIKEVGFFEQLQVHAIR